MLSKFNLGRNAYEETLFLKCNFKLERPTEFHIEKKQLHYSWRAKHCTVVDGANIAPGREVDEDTSRYGSASSCKDSFTPAHIF